MHDEVHDLLMFLAGDPRAAYLLTTEDLERVLQRTTGATRGRKDADALVYAVEALRAEITATLAARRRLDALERAQDAPTPTGTNAPRSGGVTAPRPPQAPPPLPPTHARPGHTPTPADFLQAERDTLREMYARAQADAL